MSFCMLHAVSRIVAGEKKEKLRNEREGGREGEESGSLLVVVMDKWTDGRTDGRNPKAIIFFRSVHTYQRPRSPGSIHDACCRGECETDST